MEIFDPTTGEVRSSGGNDLKNDVAAWFVDDDYNEESFFVRQPFRRRSAKGLRGVNGWKDTVSS